MLTRKAWTSSFKHLPDFLRDFHDQKSVFKTLWDRTSRVVAANPEAKRYLGDLNWVSAHVYVIDHFLLQMAQYGYTLQKTRFKPEDGFEDLFGDIQKRKDRETEAFCIALNERRKPEEELPK